MRILFLTAALAACSAQPAPENAGISAPDSSTAVAQATSTPPAAASQAAPVRPGELQTFGDWAVGCDNTALCTMASLGSENGVPGDLVMAVLRQPGREGAIDLAFDIPGDGAPVSPVAVAIDDRRIVLPALNGPAATRVAEAMASGAELSVLAPAERGRISLRGASAALRWMDERQGRAGTVTALVAKGPKPVSTVPERAAAPVIRAAVPTGAPVRPTARQLAAMNRTARCEMPAGTDAAPTLGALGGGRTLVVVPCSAGAYNVIGALFILDGDGVAPAALDAPAGFDEKGADSRTPVTSVVNGTWKKGELTSYAKGRGIGDCGVRQTFVWDGDRLRLAEQSAMGECRGNPNYITTWRAQVVRR